MKIKIKNHIRLNDIVILICLLMFVLFNIIYGITKDDISTEIFLGANYKTFTLGLNEYFRLITSGFCHFSILHLICNMVSLYSLGTFIETVYGKKKYLIYLLTGILFGSLTSGILKTNYIEIGLSAGLYTFFVIVILYIIVYKQVVASNFFTIIFVNLCINFIPGVSWQGHLGGAISGFIFFFIDYYKRTNNKMNKDVLTCLLIISIIFLSYKYYSTKQSINKYPITDWGYAYYIQNNFPVLKDYYYNKIYNYYE